jgi:membrane fusion protein, macrolide-specific efflux system
MRKLSWLLALGGAAGIALWLYNRPKPPASTLTVVPVERRDISRVIRATGTVEPRDLVPVRAPVLGRIDKAIAEVGQRVKAGEVLAKMSSADRAAVLDEALSQGTTVYKRWAKFYQPTSVVAPVGGLIISRDAVEGQTVRLGDSLFTIADELIVRAQVDESDVAAVKKGQTAIVRAESDPGRPIEAEVGAVGLQAKPVDGVNLFTVELRPLRELTELKTGMSADVQFLVESRKGVLALPAAALRGKERMTVKLLVLDSPKAQPRTADVALGISDGRVVEVVSGVPEGGAIVVPKPGFLDGERARP